MNERKRKINLFLHSIEYLLAFGIFFLFGIIHTLALETKTIYSVNNNGTLASANTYNYGYLTGGGTQGIARANVNTTVSGVAYGFNFQFYESVVLSKTYTLVINFMDIDLLKTFNSSMVRVATCNGDTCNDNTIVSVVKNNNSGNSNKLTIQFNPITTGSVILVNLGSSQAITGISTFGIKSVTLDSTNQSQDIIDSNTQNSNNIINNQNSNTQDIIDSSASNTEVIVENQEKIKNELIEAQYTCKVRSITLSNYISIENGRLNTANVITTNGNYNVTDYIKILPKMPYSITLNYNSGQPGFCVYDKDLNPINCESYNNRTTIDFTSASTAQYIRLSVHRQSDINITTLGGNICLKDTDENTNAINDLNDSINDDDIGGATQDGADFILDFDTNTFGLTSIVTAPLNLIQSLTSSSCSELELPLPFLNNKKLKLPCMTTIYQNTFGSLFTMYQTITFGIIAYWVCVRIFNQVKDFKNPEHDEIEVVDL